MRVKKAGPKRAERIRARPKDVDKKILAILARKGMSWPYDLSEKEKVATRQAVYDALKRLRNKKLIEKIEKIGSRNTYRLTTFGLFVALYYKETWGEGGKHINQVANQQANKLPLIFGKWDYFTNSGATGVIIAHLKDYFSFPQRIVHLSPYSLLMFTLEKKDRSLMDALLNKDFEKYLQDDLNRSVIFPYIFGVVFEHYLPKIDIPETDVHIHTPVDVCPDIEKWVKVLLGDPDLKSYLFYELDYLEKYCNQCSDLAMFISSFL